MADSLRATITEVVGVMRNDTSRGGATSDLLETRHAAVGEAAAAHEPFAYREALIELAACATALASRLPAPAAPVPRVAGRGEHPIDAPPTRSRSVARKHALHGRRAA